MAKKSIRNKRVAKKSSLLSLVILSILVFVFYIILETNDQIGAVYPFNVLGREEVFGSGVYTFGLLRLVSLGLILYTLFYGLKSVSINPKYKKSLVQYLRFNNDEGGIFFPISAFATLAAMFFYAREGGEVAYNIILVLIPVTAFLFYRTTKKSSISSASRVSKSKSINRKFDAVSENIGGKKYDILMAVVFAPFMLLGYILFGFASSVASSILDLYFIIYFASFLAGISGFISLLKGKRRIGLILCLISIAPVYLQYLASTIPDVL